LSDIYCKHGAGKGQVEDRQGFVIRSETGRYRTAGKLGVRAGRVVRTRKTRQQTLSKREMGKHDVKT
jgi:hypothetical protein